MIRITHIARELLANFLMGNTGFRWIRKLFPRTICNDISQQTNKIVDQYDFFKKLIGESNIKGKTIIEIGPGDAIPLAFLFLADGAKKYIAVDRFIGNIGNKHARNVYLRLIKHKPELNNKDDLIDSMLKDDSSISIFPYSIESFSSAMMPIPKGDIIISNNVVEHLSDLNCAFQNMRGFLSEDGLMIHKVDYGPHGLDRNYENPLTFLTIQERLWKLMGSNRGYPNRQRNSQVLTALENAGFENNWEPTSYFSKEKILKIRPHLDKAFREMDEEDLEICGSYIVSKIPKLSDVIPKSNA